MVKITWLGHAAFLIESGGLKILTDPYDSGEGRIKYRPISIPVDIVTISHDHFDHNYTKGLMGDFQTLDKTGVFQVKGAKVTGFESYHDPQSGTLRGPNIVFVIEVDGLRICHAGDLGHVLSKEHIKALGSIDVLLIPVGGNYTVDAQQATEVVDDLHPKLVIPMHFKTDSLDFPIETVEAFTRGKKNIKVLGSPSLEISQETLPETTEIRVLSHLL